MPGRTVSPSRSPDRGGRAVYDPWFRILPPLEVSEESDRMQRIRRSYLTRTICFPWCIPTIDAMLVWLSVQ